MHYGHQRLNIIGSISLRRDQGTEQN